MKCCRMRHFIWVSTVCQKPVFVCLTFVDLLCFFSVLCLLCLCASVYMCLVVTCWERADVCSVQLWVCHFPIGILGQVWYLIVSFLIFAPLLILILYVPVNDFSFMLGQVFLCWTSTKQGLMCLAQGHNPVMQVRLKPTTPWSRVKHYTTQPLHLTTPPKKKQQPCLLVSRIKRVKLRWCDTDLVWHVCFSSQSIFIGDWFLFLLYWVKFRFTSLQWQQTLYGSYGNQTVIRLKEVTIRNLIDTI